MKKKNIEARRRQRRNRRRRKRQERRKQQELEVKIVNVPESDSDEDCNLPPFTDRDCHSDILMSMEADETVENNEPMPQPKSFLSFDDVFEVEAPPQILQKRLEEERSKRQKLVSQVAYCMQLTQSYKDEMKDARRHMRKAMSHVTRGTFEKNNDEPVFPNVKTL